LRQDYQKIRQAGAELAMISPDGLEAHRRYALDLFGEELPYLYVHDSSLDIAKRYRLLREEEHRHGGYYYRSLWILNSDGIITHERIPWDATTQVAQYQLLFEVIRSEPGEWRPTCGLKNADRASFLPE
jgi:peroxiredoxin